MLCLKNKLTGVCVVFYQCLPKRDQGEYKNCEHVLPDTPGRFPGITGQSKFTLQIIKFIKLCKKGVVFRYKYRRNALVSASKMIEI